MGLFDLPIDRLIYLALRFSLSGVSLAAAATSLVFAWSAWRNQRPWRLAAVGGILLGVAAALSPLDAIDTTLRRAGKPVAVTSWLWFFLFDLLLPIWAFMLILAWRERDRALAELSRLSVTDQLTGTLNRRGFLERASTAIAQARRAGCAVTVAMFDLDRFKVINDCQGHAAGDLVLRALANELATAMRPGDLLGRLGGEEFAILLYDIAPPAAAAIADRLRRQVRSRVLHPGGPGQRVTISIGVAEVATRLDPDGALAAALAAADTARYAAKDAGRDRVALAGDNEAAQPTPDLVIAPLP